MELLAEKLQWFIDHPEVTWSGAGLTGLGVLYFLITKLFASRLRRESTPPVSNTFTNSGSGEQNIAQGENAVAKQVNVTQHITGNGNIVSGTGDVKVRR
ncbi:MAG: hypothetical protein WBM35_10165 [Candidatus Electrothrix sp.]